jgi:hypothetical protein
MAEANYGLDGENFSFEGTNPTGVLNSISDSSMFIGGGGGGGIAIGGGGGISSGGGTNVPISTNPAAIGTINENKSLIVNVLSNVEAQILINGENTFKSTTDKFNISLNDLIKDGAKKFTLLKNGYKTGDEFTISVQYNPVFNFDALSNINFGDSLFGYQTRLIPDYSQPFSDINQPVYSTTSPYKFRIEYSKDGVAQQFQFDETNQLVDFVFQLEKTNVPDLPPPTTSEVTIEVNVTGAADSVSYIGLNQRTLTINTKYTFTELAGTDISISTADKTQYLISRILVTSPNGAVEEFLPGGLLNRISSESSTVLLKFVADENLKIDVETIAAPAAQSKPSIAFVNPDSDVLKKYNINSKSPIPIALKKSSTVSDVAIYVGNEVFKFTNLNDGGLSTILSLPANAFQKIGNYRIVIIPSRQKRTGLLLGNVGFGDGEPIEFLLNVVSEAYVGVPDIRNITYPSELIGPDFKGTDVDFQITFESINTDYVRIFNGTKYIQVGNSGDIKLNVKQLLELGGQNIAEDNTNIVINLKLVPYNTSGFEIVVGKEEFVTIKFVKSQYTIPREVAINRIASTISSQFDKTLLRERTSKYLSHLLHFGEGDNKLITVWTGSENSLILKLYEPLPTTVQENQQVWISKILSNPIIDTVRLIGETSFDCKPLKGPNFGLEPDNGIGFQVFDDLLATGSYSTNLLYNKYVEDSGIDTSKLNITYASGSEYVWNNFVNFGSAEERTNNFFYKLELLLGYISKYELITGQTFNVGGIITEDAGGAATPEIEGNEYIATETGDFEIQYETPILYGSDSINERGSLLKKINQIIQNFDGFEKWLYTSTNPLAYPKFLAEGADGIFRYNLYQTNTPQAEIWYDSIVASSEYYDRYNVNYLSNNIPSYIQEDYDNNDFLVFLDMIGQHFDIIWVYINALKTNNFIEEKQAKGVIDSLVEPMLASMGWNPKRAFNTNFLWEYVYGTNKEGNQLYSMPLEQANNEVWRRILNNLPYLLKHKGTGRALKAAMACYGVPQSMLTIMEFGGPQDPTKGGSSKFTFDDRTAAIFLTGSLNSNGSSNVKIPWHITPQTGEHPNCIEFRILPSKIPTNYVTLISGSQWALNLYKTTGSFGKLELNFGGNVGDSPYFATSGVGTPYFTSSIEYVLGPDLVTGSIDFPISTENYSNVVINRYNYAGASSLYEVWLATGDGKRIITTVSMSLLTADTEWESGSSLQIGGNGFEGNIDEFRLWEVPLQRSKFENHTLFPDAINGNSYTASTADLIFRLDFEYPKDRTKDSFIKNVAINESYGEPFASASNMYSASAYPYQYTPYERTVTATVPSLGFNYSNKIRFETQTLKTDLSYKTRATEKSFDRAPIDSNRLGLFFSPIKELNMDILKAFGDFNIDNYIGDPSDEYRENYKQLEVLREYYFDRLENRNIYEYIQLVKYIDKSLFDVLTELCPARAKISKGLLIEPHFLERSKVKWNRPESLRNDFDAYIDNQENDKIESTYDVRQGDLDAQDVTTFNGELNNYDGVVDADSITILEGTNPTYAGTIDYNVENLETEYPTYPQQGSYEIQCPTGASLYGEADSFSSTQIGMDRNSLANLGYGLYAKRGNSVYRRFDDIFGNLETTGSRVSAFLVKELKPKKKKTQTGGYPATTSGPVTYTTITTFEDKYYVSLLPFSGSISIGNDVVQVTAINGYLPTHYKFVNGLGEGMQRSFWKGSLQTAATTPDGLPAVETFTTNPNILRVAKTGRGSGEPILEVD